MSNMYGNDGSFGGFPPQPPTNNPIPPNPPRRGMSRRTKAGAVVLGCAVLAGGAFAATDALSSPSSAADTAATSPAASPSGTTGTAASGPTGQAAILNSALSAASDTTPASAASTPAQKKAVARRARAVTRLRLLGGMHGEFTFDTKKGPRTLAYERGTVQSVSGSDVTVKAKDGTTWTWVLTSKSAVREDGKRTSSSALATGDTVFTGGPVTGSTRDIRLIVVRPSAKS